MHKISHHIVLVNVYKSSTCVASYSLLVMCVYMLHVLAIWLLSFRL